MLSDEELWRLAERKRREARGEWLELCDGVLGLLGRVRDWVCPKCEERRVRRTAAQRKWRRGKRG